MKGAVLYGYPPSPGGEIMQGHMLMRGMRDNGIPTLPINPFDEAYEAEKIYDYFKPDFAVGVGFWADTPDVILTPQKYGIKPIPWFNADGWVANYHDILNQLPLILVTSNWVKSTYIRDGVNGDKIHVVPIGYDPEVFKPLPKDDPGVKQIRELMKSKDGEKIILTAGGDTTSKGSQEMLRALAKVDKEFKNWKYVMKTWPNNSAEVHGGEEKQLIKELGLDENKIITLRGIYPPELMSYLLNACDIYAAPSRLEGFGMIQLEAQACGKPVISINVGGPRDTIVHGETGFLADVAHEVKLDREWADESMGFDKKMLIEFPRPKTFAYRADIDQLAESTLKLLKDDSLREKLGNAAAKHALENFHYKDISKKVIDLIQEHVLV